MRVKVTEKPGEWPYVMVNDFKVPPYMAYEVKDEVKGTISFVRVLKADMDDSVPVHPINTFRVSRTKFLTNQRQAVVSQFLRDTIRKPKKCGRFRSKKWLQEFVKFVGMFDGFFKLTPKIIDSWLEDQCFQKLIENIERNEKQNGTDNCAFKIQKKFESKEKAEDIKKADGIRKISTPSSLLRAVDSSLSSDWNMDTKSDEESSDDDDLFTPVVRRRCKRKA